MKNANYALAVSTNEETIKIGIATTPEEKRAIYRLRYNIYAEEISFNLMSVDHKNKLLYDEMDDWAILFYARVGSNLIATARTNIGTLVDFSPEVVQTYRMDKFGKFYNEGDNPNFAVISKGMVVPEYRRSLVSNLLMKKHYELYCAYQVQFAFVNCNFHLIPLHEHYGSRRIGKNTLDDNLGPMTSFVMLVDDIQYLRRAGSPLIHTACNRTALNHKAADWFQTEFFEENKITVNSQFITADELWTIIHQYFADIPNYIIPIIKGLAPAEAKEFLHFCSTIVQCHVGDSITMGGNTSQELIILLSGIAQSSTHGTILPGQFCGENGLVNRTTHTASVIAVSNATILVLSFHCFKKFIKSHPNTSLKILNNLQQRPNQFQSHHQ